MQTVNFCIQMAVLMSVGVLAGKVGIADAGFTKKFSRLLVNFLIPCMAFSVMVKNYSAEKLGAGMGMMLGCIGVLLTGFLIALAAGKLRGRRDDLSYILIPSVMFMNANIIGFPVIQAMFGDEALVYANFFMIPYRPLFYTLMPMLMAGFTSNSNGNVCSSALKSLNTPSVYASFLGLFAAMLGIKLPDILLSVTGRLGDAAMTLGMVACGMYVSGVKLKKSLFCVECWIAVFLRNIMTPLAVLLLFSLLKVDVNVLKLCVTFAAMPIPSMAANFADQAGRNSTLAASAVLDSTVFSIITLPLWGMILSYVN